MKDLMKDEHIRQWPKNEWPQNLHEIPTPPDRLYIRGAVPEDYRFLCIVGPRRHTEYARRVCEKLIEGLAGHPICIVSGLAYGIDSIAHELALENKLPTIAFPGSGLGCDVIYPPAHFGLAEKILRNGGALISEFESDFGIHRWMFPQRNRLMAGIADAVLIIEAGNRSGTMITARLALDYNREIGVVPSPVFNENSIGSHSLLKQGAHVITEAKDVLEMLGLDDDESGEQAKQKTLSLLSENERKIMQIITEPLSTEEICNKTGMALDEVSTTISQLEIAGHIRLINGKICQK